MQPIGECDFQHKLCRRSDDVVRQIHASTFCGHLEVAGLRMIEQDGIPKLGPGRPFAGLANNRRAQHAGFVAASAVIIVSTSTINCGRFAPGR